MNTEDNISQNPTPEGIEVAEETSPEQTLENELNQLRDQWMRTLADMDNLRKRSEREKEDARKYSVSSFARDLLGVSDNFRRALESLPAQDEMPEIMKNLVVGIEMTARELANCLEKYDVKEINPLHEPFDPNFHQAMFEIESSEHPVGTILQVLQVGYVIHDRLLRPAMVAVSKMSTEQAAS